MNQIRYASDGSGTSGQMLFDCREDAFGPMIRATSHTGKPEMAMDWYCNRLQMIVYDREQDESKVAVRFNPDGNIAEIAVDPLLLPLVRASDGGVSPWEDERDKAESAQA